MVRVLGKRAKDQLVTLVVAVRVPPPSEWPDHRAWSDAHQPKWLAEGCGALSARRVAERLVVSVRRSLALLGGVRYVTGAEEAGLHASRHPSGRQSRAQETPYIEVYDAEWIPAEVPSSAYAAAAAEAVALARRAPVKTPDASLGDLENPNAKTPIASRSRRGVKRRRAEVVDTFSTLTGATRASEDVLRWTRQLRVRLMWRPPGGRGMLAQNLLRTACATVLCVPLPLTADELTRDAASRGRRREYADDSPSVALRVAIRVHYT